MVISEKDGKKLIYDPIRKKNVLLQPEEFVRQLLIRWLTEEGNIHKNRIQVEKMLMLNGLTRRFDVVVYDPYVQPYILIECKAPEVLVNQTTFDQIAMYNMKLEAPYLIVTNGVKTYFAKMDHICQKYHFFDQVPLW